jgi:hypothetical protein
LPSIAMMIRHPSNFGSSTQLPARYRGALLEASIGWNDMRTPPILPDVAWARLIPGPNLDLPQLAR